MGLGFSQTSDTQPGRIRLTHFCDLSELESGVYWPQLQPYFIKPYFRRLTYRLTRRGMPGKKQDQVLSTRGASGLGDLDVAYVRDRFSTVMSINDAGLPDYCLTSVSQGEPLLSRARIQIEGRRQHDDGPHLSRAARHASRRHG
jgi:hypothetical protein